MYIYIQIFYLVLKSVQRDWQLRGTFFDCIVGVAAYVGWQSSTILKPLLQQVAEAGTRFSDPGGMQG